MGAPTAIWRSRAQRAVESIVQVVRTIAMGTMLRDTGKLLILLIAVGAVAGSSDSVEEDVL